MISLVSCSLRRLSCNLSLDKPTGSATLESGIERRCRVPNNGERYRLYQVFVTTWGVRDAEPAFETRAVSRDEAANNARHRYCQVRFRREVSVADLKAMGIGFVARALAPVERVSARRLPTPLRLIQSPPP